MRCRSTAAWKCRVFRRLVVVVVNVDGASTARVRGSTSGGDTALSKEAVGLAVATTRRRTATGSNGAFRNVSYCQDSSSKVVLTASLWVVGNAAAPTLTLGIITLVGQSLSKGRALAQHRSLPVDDVHGGDEESGNAEEDGDGVFKVLAAGFANVCEEWDCREGEHTSEEVSGPTVSTGS